MAAQHLFLIRHGESAWNAEQRLQGQADAPLSDAGRDEARALAASLAVLPPARVVTSDLERARETAELAGFGGGEPDPRWRERGLGAWEGMLEADVPPAELAAFRRAGQVPPGGEAWDAFQARVAGAVEELAARGGSWLVFTHGGCVRAAVAHLTGADARTVAGPANASLTLLELAPRRRLLVFNWTPEPGVPRASDPGAVAATAVSGSDRPT